MHRNEDHRWKAGGSVRPAMTLIEMLVLLALFAVITDFTVKMVRMFAGDIPRIPGLSDQCDRAGHAAAVARGR